MSVSLSVTLVSCVDVGTVDDDGGQEVFVLVGDDDTGDRCGRRKTVHAKGEKDSRGW